jgi:hypothetical protein
MSKNRTIIIAIIALLILGGGGLLLVSGNRSDSSGEIVSAPIQETVIETEAVVEEVIQETATETVNTPEVSIEEESQAPTPRVGLVATDPSTVELASGKLQLVEAFAFW